MEEEREEEKKKKHRFLLLRCCHLFIYFFQLTKAQMTTLLEEGRVLLLGQRFEEAADKLGEALSAL